MIEYDLVVTDKHADMVERLNTMSNDQNWRVVKFGMEAKSGKPTFWALCQRSIPRRPTPPTENMT